METNLMVKPKGGIIRNIYLYLVSFVALMMMVFSVADLVNITLKTFVFPKADDYYSYYEPICTPAQPTDGSTTTAKETCISKEEQEKRNKEQRIQQRQSSLVRDISMIVVAVPVFAYHWMIIRKKENE